MVYLRYILTFERPLIPRITRQGTLAGDIRLSLCIF